MRSDITDSIIVTGILLMVFLWSCTDEPDVPLPTGTDYSDGVFVTNEGNFGSGSGTLTFIKRDGTGLEQKVYQNANDLAKLGNVVQSMHVIGDSAYIVVNNSNRIVVCNKFTMRELTAIEDIYQPRHLVNTNDGRFAVSCWDNTVKIFETRSLSQVNEIETSTGPEKMMVVGDHLWILNQGGLSIDSCITIADLNTGFVQTLAVYPRPTGIQEDSDGSIWVMCSGRSDHHPGGYSPSHLIRMDRYAMTVSADFMIQQDGHDAIGLSVNKEGNILYFLFLGDIYQFEIEALQPDVQPLVDYMGTFYSMGYDPKDNTLYGADVLDYNQNGEIYKYDATSGTFLMNFKAGIIPGGFYFSMP
ncbi:MAG: hypothetical protein JW861_11235 [Bacteroidales bacterium]|nr:hypothetical protein [Bacteroidales bacterium]